MTHVKALQVAQLIKLFAHSMNEEGEQAEQFAIEFNAKLTEFFEEHPDETVTTFACYVTLAIDPPGEGEPPSKMNTDVFARVFPDVLRVRGGMG